MDDRSKPTSSAYPSTQRRVLTVLALALVAASLLLLLPLWASLLLALWTAAMLKPLFARLSRAVGGRSRGAALLTIGLLATVIAPIAIALAVVAPDTIELAQRALHSDSGQGALTVLVSGEHQGPSDQAARVNADKVVQMVEAHGQQAWTVAALLTRVMGMLLLGVVSYFIGVYATLVYGQAAYAWVRERLPLDHGVTDRLRDAFQETGRGLLFSVALTALAQATLATIAYVSLGVPRALALGLATFLTSVIPAIGPFLVWGPVALALVLSGSPIRAAILAGVCIVIVAPADNVLRPVFAKLGKLQLHPFVVFFSMLGGMITIGGWGLMLGPLVARMALEAVEILRERAA